MEGFEGLTFGTEAAGVFFDGVGLARSVAEGLEVEVLIEVEEEVGLVGNGEGASCGSDGRIFSLPDPLVDLEEDKHKEETVGRIDWKWVRISTLIGSIEQLSISEIQKKIGGIRTKSNLSYSRLENQRCKAVGRIDMLNSAKPSPDP